MTLRVWAEMKFVYCMMIFLSAGTLNVYGGHRTPPATVGSACFMVMQAPQSLEEYFVGVQRPSNLAAIPSQELADFVKSPTEEEPLRKELTYLYNDYYHALRKRDLKLIQSLEVEIPRLLDLYDRSESLKLDNPVVMQKFMRSGWYFAKGDYEMVIRLHHEIETIMKLPSPFGEISSAMRSRRRAVVANNLAAATRRLAAKVGDNARKRDLLEQALEYVKRALDEDRMEPGYLVEYILTLDDLGRVTHDESWHFSANTTLLMLLQLADLSNDDDPITTVLKHEDDIFWRDHLSSVLLLKRELIDHE